MGVKIYRKHMKSGLPSNKSRNSEICAGHQAKATQTQTHTQTHTRMEREDILRVSVIRSSQELFPNHQNIHRPPSKSNANPNCHTGRSRSEEHTYELQ